MKEKYCKIVQDLLPNYIETLTNEETNLFIEAHLKSCKECTNILENMKKDLKINNLKREEREIKYIKKFNKKFKLLRNILVIIVVLFIIIVGRKTFILSNLANKAVKVINETNYYTKTESYSKGQMTILESYNKDGITLGTMNVYSKENNAKKIILYKSDKETIALIDNGTTKTLTNMGDISINPVFFTGENLLENVVIAIVTRVDKIELNGQKCYIIRDGNTEKFIDVNTGLAIKMIDNENNITTDYQYEFGVVKDTDIVKPNTTEYTIIE